MNPKKLTTPFQIIVTVHARERARSRFPGFKAARIVDEVREALVAGRLSPNKPAGLMPPDDPKSLYCWTPAGDRVFALRHDSAALYVTTCMRPSEEAAA